MNTCLLMGASFAGGCAARICGGSEGGSKSFPKDGDEKKVLRFERANGSQISAAVTDPKADESEPLWAKARPPGTPAIDEHFICMGGPAPGCPAPPASAPPKVPLPSEESLAASSWAQEKARPPGTPQIDEHFICMGGPAPRCPGPAALPGVPGAGAAPLSSGPITLEVLQGQWLGSGGAEISVLGTAVYLNGLPLSAHKVELREEDGTVLSIGRLWQLQGWAQSTEQRGGLEWRASSTRENMECARSEVWTRKHAAAPAWAERMKLMGYAGSAASPLDRGVEGCIPGTDGADMPAGGYAGAKDAEEVGLLQELLSEFREPELCRVRSAQVVPDFTNRAETGLGVELVHYIAKSFKKHGFQKRQGQHGHDIPVVVREPPGSDFHGEALRIWKKRAGEEEGFPEVRAKSDEELFTSLGNGHFFQALNLYACAWKAINDPTDQYRYRVEEDAALREAIEDGVPSIVLHHDTPKRVRAKIAALLNSKREFSWTLQPDGSVDVSKMEESTDYCSQFEWLTKGMDAVQVDCLVRTHLKITDSHRIQG